MKGQKMFKAGDRVQTRNGHLVGTVLYTPLEEHLTVRVRWDDPSVECNEQKARLILVEPEKKPKAEGFLYKKGDRVRLKWNKSGGTVQHDQSLPEEHVFVKWDHLTNRRDTLSEKPEDLVALYTPRERDEPHPMQAALDNIAEEREKLKKQIEDLQFKLGGLTKAYKMIEEGW